MTGNESAGGFVGQVNSNGLVADSCYDTIQYSFKGFVFVAIWMMDGVNESPDLRAFQPTAFQLWLEDKGQCAGCRDLI